MNPEPTPNTPVTDEHRALADKVVTAYLTGPEHVGIDASERVIADAFAAKDAEVAQLKAQVQKLNPERIAPVQGYAPGIPWSIHMRAYAAYCNKWSPQEEMITGWCRGGFHTSELDHFVPGWREEVKEITQLRDALTDKCASVERLTKERDDAAKLNPGGYDYFVRQVILAEERTHNALYVADKLRTEVERLRELLEKADEALKFHSGLYYTRTQLARDIAALAETAPEKKT